MKRRILCLLLAFVLSLGLFACQEGGGEVNGGGDRVEAAGTAWILKVSRLTSAFRPISLKR